MPGANTCEVNVRRETGKFKPVIFLQIHAAGDSRYLYAPAQARIHSSSRAWLSYEKPRQKAGAQYAGGQYAVCVHNGQVRFYRQPLGASVN